MSESGPVMETPGMPIIPGISTAAPPTDTATQRKKCARCGMFNEAVDRYCHRCGWTLDNAQVAIVDPGNIPAGFWIRFLATIIDTALLWIVGAILDAISSSPFDALRAIAWFSGIRLILGLTYNTLMVGAKGGTVGKLVLGMRVIKANGGPVSYGRAFCRALASWLSVAAFGLGYIWIAFDKEKRGWHDHIAGTKVVRKP